MKKLLIALAALLILILGLLLWLAGSVGPETAPQELKSMELELPND